MRRVLLLCVAFSLASTAGAYDRASYLLRGDQAPLEGGVNGHHQGIQRIGDAIRVDVITEMAPINAEASYSYDAVLRPKGVPESFELPVELRRRLRREHSAFQAATAVLEWVMLEVDHDGAEEAPQDAPSVLDRRRGRCSGVANLATAMLMAAGFEARSVSGLLMSDHGALRHRWIECLIPGVGWIPADPTLGLWVVTARHIAFESPVANLPQIEVLESAGPVPSWLPRRNGRPARPERGASLDLRTRGSAEGLDVVLRGPGNTVQRFDLGEVETLPGLMPGTWVIEVYRGERIGWRRTVSLAVDHPRLLVIDLRHFARSRG